MPLGDLFKLSKLAIFAYPTSARQEPPSGQFTVQYNPETLSIHQESVYSQQQGVGTTSGGEGGWSFNRPERLSVTLVIDGTGVGLMGIELVRHVPTVAEQISSFLAICRRVQGKEHEPAYLKLHWGKGVLQPGFDCRLESVDVNYKTFDRDGSPLHAELVAVFVERLAPKKEAAQINRSSPDLTHRRVVLEGDTLPQLCREIYGSPLHYVRVAQVNRLDDFRNLTAGQELVFPPFEGPRRV